MSKLRATGMTVAALATAGGPAMAEIAHAEVQPGVVATEILDGVLAKTGQSFAFPGNPNAVQVERTQFDDCFEGEPPIWQLGTVSTRGTVKVDRLAPVQDCEGYIDQELVTNVIMSRISRADGTMGSWRATKVSLKDTPDDAAKSGMTASFKWTPTSKRLPAGRKGQAYIKTTVKNVNQTAEVPGVPLGEVGQARTAKTRIKKVVGR
jgi:hypothetical protein